MIAAVVLAAGEASRFGASKQLLRIGDRTLLEHVLATVRQSKVAGTVVVLGAYADEIKRTVRFARERVVINAEYASGMSSSIQAGLRVLGDDVEAALMVLGDQPFVVPATIDKLIAEYLRTRKRIVIPTHRGARGNPVLVDRILFPALMNIGGDVGLRVIFADYERDIAKVEVEDRGVVTDIDTEEDLRISRAYGLGPSD